MHFGVLFGISLDMTIVNRLARGIVSLAFVTTLRGPAPCWGRDRLSSLTVVLHVFVSLSALEIMSAAAEGSLLDAEIMQIWQGSSHPSKLGKRRTFRTKFVVFAYETGALPVLPIKAKTYFRYMVWLPKNGVNGWESALRYLTNAIDWDREEMGSPDLRDDMEFFWSKFRANYKQTIAADHSNMKLPMRAALLEAIYLIIDWSCWSDVQAICAYTVLLFVGVRIGHLAVGQQRTHAMRFEDFRFFPSYDEAEFVYVHFRSTKTRPRACDTPYWSAVKAQPHLLLCPVAAIKRIFSCNYRGDSSGFVFRASKDSSAPLPRSSFTANLRRHLTRAQAHIDTPFNIVDYSGVSFRKGFLTILGAAHLPGYRLAAAADHASIQSSTPYMVDMLQDRAANSNIIGAAFSPRL